MKLWVVCTWLSCVILQAGPIQIDNRLELFVDYYLVEKMEGVRLELGHPKAEEIVLRCEESWEGSGPSYVTVLKDGENYKMYYRSGVKNTVSGKDDVVICYAASLDGSHWIKPILGLQEYQKSRLNNILLPPDDQRQVNHDFAPFIDERSGVPKSERFKAVGGVTLGLFRFVSEDGVRWRSFSDEPLFKGYALDSLNVALWVPAENCYAIYLRNFISKGGQPAAETYTGIRSISRSVSKDFITWSKPEQMTFGNTPLEDLYTNGTHPYFRAPHILIALPFRFWPDRRVQSDDEQRSFGVVRQRQGISDAVLMTTRGGTVYDRTFMESFIRPGLDRRNWHARNTKPAKGIVPTGNDEMSIYVATHNELRSSHIRRYSLPFDRLASVHAGYSQGSLTTKAITFSGDKLVINYSTSAAGSIRIEILDEGGKPVGGYSAQDCDEVIGDEIARVVRWNGNANLGALIGKAIRLRFLMSDSDIYSFRFGSKDDRIPITSN